jgi:hypothetical protein
MSHNEQELGVYFKGGNHVFYITLDLTVKVSTIICVSDLIFSTGGACGQ